MGGAVTESSVQSGVFAAIATAEALPGIARGTIHGAQMTVVRYVYQPGSVFPMHQHPQEQFTYIVSGRIVFTVDGIEQELGPGDFAIIPGDTPHGAQVNGDLVVETINIMSPRRDAPPTT